MREDLQEILRRQIFLLQYDKTLSLLEQSTAGYIPKSGLTPEREREIEFDIEKKKNDPAKYPNYCSHPKMAILPPKNKLGLEGEEALAFDEEKGIRYCYYAGANGGIDLPEFAKIEFININTISNTVDDLIKSGKETEENRDVLLINLRKILPISTVSSFDLGYGKFVGNIQKKGSNSWYFNTYVNENTKETYVNPPVKDRREEYQKFLDEWGLKIQIGLALATAIAGWFTGGSSWVLTAEILAELGMGTLMGIREYQKGNNVAAAVSFITGVLPMLKLTYWFRGVSEETFKSLSSKLITSGLDESSNIDDYIKFYNGLEEQEKYLFSQILKQDEISRTKMLDEVGKVLSKESTSVLDDVVLKQIKETPNLLTDIKFFDRLWVREIGSNLAVVLVGLASELLFGKYLNDEQKQRIKEIYWEIPENHRKEYIFNLMQNADKIDSINNSEIIKKAEKVIPTKKHGEALSTYWNTAIKDSVESAGGTHTELPDDSAKSADEIYNNEQLTGEELEKAKSEGWIDYEELSPDDEFYDDKGRHINNKFWVLKK